MELIEKMHRGLSRRYPEERFEAGNSWIRYLPSTDDGFEVAFEISKEDYVVMFDGWHDRFDEEEEAIDWFVLGLSEDCRLKITAKGNQPFRWVVEARIDDESFAPACIMGTVPLFFWRRSTVEYRQNHLAIERKQENACDIRQAPSQGFRASPARP